MLNRKIFEVLAQLSPAEKKRLRQFLASPYFNQGAQSTDVLRLYEHILKHGAEEAHPLLSKEKVFQWLYPARTFQEKVKSPLDSLTTELFGLIKKFLLQQEREKDAPEIHEHLALLRFYRKHSYEDRFWKTMVALRDLQKHSPFRDAAHYLLQFYLEEEEQKFRGAHNAFADDVNLHAVHSSLDLFYSMVKLEYTCSLFYQQRAMQTEKQDSSPLMDLILKLTAEDETLHVPITQIYRQLAKCLSAPYKADNIESLEELLNKYQALTSSEKFKNLKAYVRFLQMREYEKRGGSESLRQIFQMYREHFEKGYFYIEDQVPFSTYRNLVIFSLKLKEFAWAKKFLDTHGPERICGTRFPAEVHSLNLAEYFFSLKDYEQALSTLIYRNFENPTISIAVDLLIIKIYFETRNDLLESRMKALEQKIRRYQLSRETKNRYLNFLKKLDKIARYGWQSNHPKREKWVAEIKATPEIVAREWLLEQLAAQ